MADENWESVKNQRYILNSENITFREFFDLISDNLGVKRPAIFAGNLLLNFGCRMSSFASFLTGIRPTITRETVRSANKLSYYDGSKILRAIGIAYTPITISIQNTALLFLNDIKNK